MTDYSDWTETEIDREEFYATQQLIAGPHLRRVETYTGGASKEWAYYRLDPPAPKYREGEMRWLTHAGQTYLVKMTERGHWQDVNDPTTYWDSRGKYGTLSEPVVVVPAPTDEERADFLDAFDRGLASPHPRGAWVKRVAAAMKEARDE